MLKIKFSINAIKEFLKNDIFLSILFLISIISFFNQWGKEILNNLNLSIFLLSFSLFVVSVLIKLNPKKFIPLLATTLTAIVTIFTALVAWQSVQISKNMADIEKQNSENNIAGLKAEYRPYITLKLLLDSNNDDKNGNTIYQLNVNNQLTMPVAAMNAGKVPALDVKTVYNAYQKDVPFGEVFNDIPPNDFRNYYPSINIGELKQYDLNNLNVVFKLTYIGNTEIDTRQFITEFYVKLMKEKMQGEYVIFKVVGTGSRFYSENIK